MNRNLNQDLNVRVGDSIGAETLYICFDDSDTERLFDGGLDVSFDEERT